MVNGKKVRGRRRYQMIDNIMINGLYEDMKRKAYNIMINELYEDTKRKAENADFGVKDLPMGRTL